jgi:hypothetical protein
VADCFFGGDRFSRLVGGDSGLFGAEVEVEEIVVICSIVSSKNIFGDAFNVIWMRVPRKQTIRDQIPDTPYGSLESSGSSGSIGNACF